MGFENILTLLPATTDFRQVLWRLSGLALRSSTWTCMGLIYKVKRMLPRRVFSGA